MALKDLVFAILFLLAWSDFTTARISEELKVQLPHGGVLVGRHWTSHKGRHIRAFMGVPFALPPVGNLRFKPPVPYGSWSGERLAIRDSAPCIHRDPFTRQTEIVGSEDCLYLNVYTPEKPRTSKPLPVMFYIHGGGFISGSGICSYYEPDYLLDHDIILVIGNYRLGPLGFLSTETLDCPGNFGLKDQTEGLRWVHNNIAAFGGDPNSVTIFGNSAGGASVTYQLVTSLSKGLVHKAIVQSGVYYNGGVQPEYKGVPAKRARKVAQLVGCNPEENWQHILRCLRTKAASDIVATLYEFYEWDFDPVVPFQPVVEPPHEGAFLTVLPRDGDMPHGFSLPLIIGMTSDEGLVKSVAILNIPGLLTDYKNQIKKILPIQHQYDHHAPEVQEEITHKIEQFYFKEGHNYDINNHQNLTNPPVPYGSWSGERLAIRDSPPCIHRDPFTRQIELVGSEDCLYINVYTPEKPRTSKPLPVMVNIHGGGFMSGSGICSFYGPDYLLDHDIILISGNYRLGPLGFLSTETLDCPGNFGLKDQTEILRWIHNNIAAFGGDPNSVTIFGVSAGGASVTYQLVTSLSEGLFHKAIVQSGSYYNPWAQPEHKGTPAKRARKLAQMVGCNPDGNWQAILRCLRTKEASDIVARLYDFFEWDFDPMVPFQPVVEPPHEGAFLTVLPRDGGVPHGFSLPLMIGITSEEGLLKTAPVLTIPGLLTDYKHQFQKILPIELQYDHHTQEVQEEITHQIKQFYFKEGHNYDKNNHQNFTDLLSDGWFVAGIDEYIKQRVEAQNSNQLPPFYVYVFEHRSASSYSEIFGDSDDFLGASHGDELQFLFQLNFRQFVSSPPTENDIELREAILQMWVNFAAYGNPTPAVSNLTRWEPVTGYPVNYARLGHKAPEEFTVLQMERNIYGDRMNFWRKLKAHIPAEQRKKQLRDEL